MKHGRLARLGVPVFALLGLSLVIAGPVLADNANATASIIAGA